MTLLPLLLTLSIIISNDAPNWLDIPLQSISEDCSEGCTNNIFSFVSLSKSVDVHVHAYLS